MAENPIIVESGGSNGGGGFMGENGGWIFAILFIAILFGGIGGYGGAGGGRGGGTDGVSSVLPLVMGSFGGGHSCGSAVSEGFALNNLQSGINAIQHGLCDTTYALNNTITSGVNSLSTQLSDCCCTTQRAIDGVNFNMAKGFCDLGNVINMSTRDVIDAQNANYRSLMDFMVQNKMADKDAQIAALTSQLSQLNQNAVIGARIDAAVAEILRRTGTECPTAAYLVNPPTPVNFPTNNCGQVQFGNSCGNCNYGWAA